MPKIPDYGHPVVRLEYRNTENGPLSVATVDDATGDELMVETIRQTGLFLRGYKYDPATATWVQS